MILLCYIAMGGLVQTFLIGITFLNALYFTVVTIETIGKWSNLFSDRTFIEGCGRFWGYCPNFDWQPHIYMPVCNFWHYKPCSDSHPDP
jgi:hypothetical protein